MDSRTQYIQQVTAAYRAQAAHEGVREVSIDEWTKIVRTQTEARFGATEEFIWRLIPQRTRTKNG